MCGIVGIIANEDISDKKDILQQMNDLQTHRGPDGEGTFASKNGKVLFGHRRLAIIDLSEAGAQPMHSSDGRYVITYNGEVYNYLELRAKCEAKGSKFNSKTDTEVIVEYIKHFGAEGVQDFRGMWAFAIHDTKEDRLIVSRDPFGIKPLHYGFKDGAFYFASEIKSLRKIHSHFKQIDEVTEKMFVENGVLDIGDWTFFKNIKSFPVAHYAEIDLNKEISLGPKCYWQPPKQMAKISEKEAVSKLKELLEQSVKRHLIADVPIAFCLSGGLDSSTITGIVSKFAKEGQKLNSFTTHYPDFPEIDETKWAKLAVEHCKTDANWIKPTVEEFAKNFDDVLYHHDEPFGSTSIYAQNAIFRGIKEANIKVSLDGQGADEIFAGYHSYYPTFLISMLHKGQFGRFLIEGFSLLLQHPKKGMKMLKQLAKQKTLGFLCRVRNKLRSLLYRVKRAICRVIKRNKALQVSSKEVTDTSLDKDEYSRRMKYLSSLYSTDFHQNLVYTLTSTSIPQLLRNGDRNSMMNSIESRVPFLDVDLVNFVVALPNCYKIRRAVTKYILRDVATDYLPKELVFRKDKMGFPSPEKSWLKKVFDIDVDGAFSNEFRKFIVSKWRKMILC